jgi:hypothetical protein
VFAAVAIDIADIFKVPDPFIQSEKIEISRRNEIDRVFVTVKKPADFRNIFEHCRWHHYFPFLFGCSGKFFV